MTWLDKLINPLRNPQYPQIQGHLVRKNFNGEIIGKCAEGEIACQNGLKIVDGTEFLSEDELLMLGIPPDFVYNLPYIHQYHPTLESPPTWTIDFEDQTDNVGHYIIRLNDDGFEYDQIIEFLETTFGDAVNDDN